MTITPGNIAKLLRELAADWDDFYASIVPLRVTIFDDLSDRARAAADALEAQERYDSASYCWFAYHPEGGTELFKTAEEAKAEAHDWLDYDRSQAAANGWHENQEWLSWGRLVTHEHAQITNRMPAPKDSAWDGEDIYDYELRAPKTEAEQ